MKPSHLTFLPFLLIFFLLSCNNEVKDDLNAFPLNKRTQLYVFSGTGFEFQEMLSADYISEYGSFRINVNNEDQKVYISQAGLDTLFAYKQGFLSSEIKDTLSVLSNNTLFQVAFLSGDSVYIKKDTSSNGNYDLQMFDRIDNQKVLLADGKETALENFLANDKLLWVEFWASWCRGCIQLLPEMKRIHEEFGEQVNILHVAHKENRLDIYQQLIDDNELEWNHALIEEEAANSLIIQALPYGILFDSAGKVVQIGVYPDDVERHIRAKADTEVTH